MMHGKAFTVDCSPARLVLGAATKKRSERMKMLSSCCVSISRFLVWSDGCRSSKGRCWSWSRDPDHSSDPIVRAAKHQVPRPQEGWPQLDDRAVDREDLWGDPEEHSAAKAVQNVSVWLNEGEAGLGTSEIVFFIKRSPSPWWIFYLLSSCYISHM